MADFTGPVSTTSNLYKKANDVNQPNAAEQIASDFIKECMGFRLSEGDMKKLTAIAQRALDAAAVQPSQSAVECARQLEREVVGAHMPVRAAEIIQAFADAHQSAASGAQETGAGRTNTDRGAEQPAVQPVQSDREAFSKAFDMGYGKGVEVITLHREQAVAVWKGIADGKQKVIEQLERQLAAQPADAVRELQEAAQAVIDRWNTPLWKDAPHTAGYIHRLREALAASQPKGGE